MTLAELSRLVGVSPKWVLNTVSGIGADGPYSLQLARQLAIARAVHHETSMPMAKAMSVARQLLRRPRSAATLLEVRASEDSDVALTVDVYRLLSSFNVRLAELNASYAPRVRGRPRTRPTDAMAKALDWGLDVTLIRDNLSKTPTQRLRQLDAMAQFSRDVRRAGNQARST